MSVSTHVCEFPSFWQTGRHTCGNVLGEMQAGFIGTGGKVLVRRSHFLCTLKNGSLLGYFSLAAAKSSDSNLATRPPIWQPHVQPSLCLFLMSNCNRQQIRAQPQLLHEAQILCDEHAFKDKLAHSTKCVQGRNKRLQRISAQPSLLSWKIDFFLTKPKPWPLYASTRLLLIIIPAQVIWLGFFAVCVR